MILGTANIFSVDQRTSALISHRMRHATKEQQEEAVKLAAMAEMCIYRHKTRSLGDDDGIKILPLSFLDIKIILCFIRNGK